jgi:hypothetical protein
MSITPPSSPRDNTMSAETNISTTRNSTTNKNVHFNDAAAQSASAALSAYARAASSNPIATKRPNPSSAAPIVTSWSASVLTRDDKLEQLAQKAAAAANAPKRPVTKIDYSLFDPDYDGNRRARNTNIQQLRSRVESRQWPKRQGVANLHALLGIYQSWAAQLRPAISFDDFLKRTHRLGSTSMIRGLLAAEREGRVLHHDDLPKRTKSESTDENKHNVDEDEDDFELRLFDDEPAPTATTAEEMFDSLFGAGSSASLAPRGPSLLDEQQQPVTISDEQRARAEENRRKALERKNQSAAQKQQSQESTVGVLDDDDDDNDDDADVPTVKKARTDTVTHEESND